MDGERTLRPVGISSAGEGLSDEKVKRHELQFSQAATLKDLSKEYAWFSMALMYAGVRLMGRDPWADYVQERGPSDAMQLTMRFDKPIFKGMEVGRDVEFNHVLWAMEKDRWKDYCEWMGQVTFLDRDQQLATRLRTQVVEIADPLFFDRAVILPAKCPTVAITVFVLDTNQGCVYVQPGQHPLMDLPQVVRTQTTLPDTKIWATAVLDDHPDPFGLVDRELNVDPMQELMARVRKVREQDEN